VLSLKTIKRKAFFKIYLPALKGLKILTQGVALRRKKRKKRKKKIQNQSPERA